MCFSLLAEDNKSYKLIIIQFSDLFLYSGTEFPLIEVVSVLNLSDVTSQLSIVVLFVNY
jgi:hypothetical protein